jgi:hypothetical protein
MVVLRKLGEASKVYVLAWYDGLGHVFTMSMKSYESLPELLLRREILGLLNSMMKELEECSKSPTGHVCILLALP